MAATPDHPVVPARGRVAGARLLASLLAGLSLAAAACAATVPAGSDVVFLPVAVDHEAFGAARPLVAEAIAAALSRAGLRPLMLDADNHATVWAQELSAAGAVVDAATGRVPTAAYARAIGALVRRIGRETGAALVLQPRIVLRPARLEGIKVDWDGRTELIPTRARYELSARFSGDVQALSLQVLAFRPDGSPAFAGFGGLALPLELNLAAGQAQLRSGDLVSPDDARLAVGIALGALAGPPALSPGPRP